MGSGCREGSCHTSIIADQELLSSMDAEVLGWKVVGYGPTYHPLHWGLLVTS